MFNILKAPRSSNGGSRNRLKDISLEEPDLTRIRDIKNEKGISQNIKPVKTVVEIHLNFVSGSVLCVVFGQYIYSIVQKKDAG